MMRVLRSIDSQTDFLEGQLLLVNKPKTWTSFDVVAKIRGALRRRLSMKKVKVGHAGTLDPLATGLVLIGVGKGTKWLHDLQGLNKIYEGQLKIGATTATYDAEMEEENLTSTEHLTDVDVEEAAKQFVGTIDQVPPIYSAVKIEGQRAYKAARKGMALEMKSRQVQIFDFKVETSDWPIFDFSVACSKGTYIRSLAHDLGQALQVGAYLTSLHRIQIGEYHIDDAWNLNGLIDAIEDGQA